MKNYRKTTRRGFSLLELIVSTAMLAALTTSCMMIVRMSYTVWHRHEGDHEQRQSGLAVLQHIARQVRQAKAVQAISLDTDDSGFLSLLDAKGNLLVWEHDTGSKEIRFGVNTATNVLATRIEELTFRGYKADYVPGVSMPTTDPGLIHMVECTAKVDIIRPASTETVTTSMRAWLRSW